MNKVHSKVWNRNLGQLVVASEHARLSGGKSGGAGAGVTAGGKLCGALMFALAVGGMAASANAATIVYDATAANAAQGTVGLNVSSLGSATMANPSALQPGSTNFNYVAVLVRPTFGDTGTPLAPVSSYRFGQSQAGVDTAMILYQGRFNPAAPGQGALVGNDDSSSHPSDVGTISCGGNSAHCPSIAYDVTAGQVYTLFISTYSANAALGFPQKFYSTGAADFGRFDNLGTIDPESNLGLPYHNVYDLDFLIKPEFEGGTLRMDKPYGTTYDYAQNFTLSDIATNTVDLYGNDARFTGVWSDKAGQAGVINLANTVGDNSITFTGNNSFTGGLSVGSGVTLNVGAAANLGAESARLALDGGTLHTTAAFSTTRAVAVGALGGSLDTDAGLTLGGVLSGAGALGKSGSGALVLTGDNDYSGTLTVNAGALKIGAGGTGGGFGSSSVRIVNNGDEAVAFNRSDDSTFAGSISGSNTAGISVSGGGTLTLSGNNQYLGATVVDASGVSISSDANLGAVGVGVSLRNGGKLINTAAISSDRAIAITGTGVLQTDAQLELSQAITGGALEKTGADTLVLTADNTYSGGTTISEGTLQIGNGGENGSILGNVLNNAALVFDRSDAVEYAGAISGTGSLAQQGSGTLILTGANTHGGGTTIAAGGTLQVGAGGTSGSLQGNVDNSGTFAFDRSDSVNFTGAISGSGSLVQQGSGTLILTGANTHGGGTTITSGSTLQLGAGGTSGSLQGNVDNSGTLAFDRSDSVEFAGVVSGSGALLQKGTGTLTLTGSNDYSGGTTIATGKLVADNGAALGSGAVNNASTLELGFATDSSVTNTLGGSGALNKTGAGVATLTGAGSAVGNVLVSGGSLALAQTGAFNATNYRTATGATTKVGEASQLNVNGAFTQDTGSTLVIGASDQSLVSANTAVLDGTLKVEGFDATQAGKASELAGNLVNVISTTNGISGDFASIDFGGAASTVDYLTLGSHKSVDGKDYSVGFGLTWEAGTASADGGFTLANAGDSFDVDVALNDQTGTFTSGWDGKSLTKAGAGTLTLSAVNGYTGATTVDGGVLKAGIANAFANSSAVTVAAGATLDLDGHNQTAKALSGAGAVTLGAATLTADIATAGSFTGAISGNGALVKTGAGDWTLSGGNSHAGGTSINAGKLIATHGGVFGSGAVNNASTLELGFATDSSVTNTLGGSGALNKTGAGVATLTGAGSAVGNVLVSGGSLALAQTGAFNATNYRTATGATTKVGEASQLNVSGAFTQDAGSTLEAVIGAANRPLVSATTATLNGDLHIAGFDASQAGKASELTGNLVKLISTSNGITGDFSNVDFGGTASAVDYLTLDSYKTNGGKDYSVGFGLTWEAGTASGNGGFTLANAGDSFDMDVALNDQTGTFTSGWDGKSLTKAGAGTLTLSAANGYTGATTVNGGVLKAGTANAFANSSAVTVAAGATLDLDGHNQTAKALSGAGAVTLGAATLTADIATAGSFTGAISGNGALVKTGAGDWTLSGGNSHAGGTSINAGKLIATHGGVFGSGAVNNASTLELGFATDSSVANTLGGSGVLNKTGAGVATLTGAGSAVGDVLVSQGGLALAQTGGFTAANYRTATGATTKVGESSQLNVSGGFTQDAGSTLEAVIGAANRPLVSATTATLNGDLHIAGFDASQAGKASELTGNLVKLISTTNGITGDFSNVDFGGTASAVDYLTLDSYKTNGGKDYSVGFGLTWEAGTASGNGGFTLANAGDSFDMDVALNDQTGTFTSGWDGKSLTKAGAGTLTLSAANGYTGATTVNGGVLKAGTANAFANSSAVTVAAGATLDLDGHNQTAKALSGAGAVTLGAATLTADIATAGSFTGAISGNGALVKTGAGDWTLSGGNSHAGGTSINAGKLIATHGGVFGSGAVNNASTLELGFATDSSVTNTLGGSGALNKTGAGVATLTGAGSTVGNVLVSGGSLALAQTGAFNATNYRTATGATTKVGGNAQLVVTGEFAQDAGASLQAVIGDLNRPLISADTATLDGSLGVTGFSGEQATTASTLIASQVTLVQTANGITGDFNPVAVDGTGSTVDYIQLSGFKSNSGKDYSVGFGLTWEAGAQSGDGGFTLAGADDVFNVDVALADRSEAFASGWDGSSLTKAGDGKLILSADNSYSGTTTIEAGTLQIGNGGTAGSVASNIVNDGALVFDRSDAFAYAGGISGSGTLSKAGSGTLALSGGNSYSGATGIQAGTLQASDSDIIASSDSLDIAAGARFDLNDFDQRVNNLSGTGQVLLGNAVLTADNSRDTRFDGSLTGAGGLLKTGAAALTLSNDSSIIGDVTVADGLLALDGSGVTRGMRAAGVGATFTVSGDYTTASGGKTAVLGEQTQLQVGGNLTQESGSVLAVTIGATPDIVADTAQLGGSLELAGFDYDGVVAKKASEVLSERVYTLISTANGINGDFDSTPLNSTGLDYIVYDGAVSRDGKNYDLGLKMAWMEGGNADATGTFSMAKGTAFDSDVVLADQVGDFASGWDGSSLTKNGEGLLVLSAANTYSGGTTINAGTVQVSSDANLGAASGALTFNGGTLGVVDSFSSGRDIEFASGMGGFDVGSNRSLTLTGDLTGAGGMVVSGLGAVLLDGQASYKGQTQLASGTLMAAREDVLSRDSDVRINNGATLALMGFDQTVANLDNAGNLFVASADGSRFGSTLTVQGNYTSNGGNLFLNSVLGDDGSVTDKLVADAVVLGKEGAIGAATQVYVANSGGLGGQTVANGIEIVHVNDPSRSDAGAFVLGDRVAAGAFNYALHQGGVGTDETDGNWYLRTVDDGYRDEVVVGTTIAGSLGKLGLSTFAGYSGRNFDGCQDARYATNRSDCQYFAETSTRGWVNVVGGNGKTRFSGSGDGVQTFEKHGANSDYNTYALVAGVDVIRDMREDNSSNIGGVYIGGSNMSTDVQGLAGADAGRTKVDAYTLGAYWRHATASDFYIDAAVQGTQFGSIKSRSNEGEWAKTKGVGMLTSLESGYRFGLDNGWSVIPQVQAIYQYMSVDSLRDSYGSMKFHGTDEFNVRGGAKLQKDWNTGSSTPMQAFIHANVWHGFGPDKAVTVTALDGSNPTTIASSNDSSWAQIGLGVSGRVKQNVTVFASGDYNKPLKNDHGSSFAASVGVKVDF